MIHHLFPDVIIPVIWIILISYLILRSSFFLGTSLKNKFFLFAFYLKIVFGLITVWIYTHIYTDRSTSDIFRYYDDGLKLFSIAKENPVAFLQILFGINISSSEIQNYLSSFNNWDRSDHFSIFNDNQFMIRLNALMCFISFGGYLTHLVFFNLLSFIGLTAIFKTFRKYYSSKEKGIFISVFLIPSTLLWCSGIIKDSLIICFLGGSIYFLDNYLSGKSKNRDLILFLLFIFLLLLAKSQAFIIAMPAWLGIIISRKIKFKRQVTIFPVTLIIYFIVIVNVKLISPSLNFLKVLSDKQADFKDYALNAKAGSYIELPVLEPSTASVIMNLPSALINSFTRPWWSESKNAFMKLSSVEILALMILLVLAFIFKDRENFKFNPFLWFAIIYVLFLFAMIGLVTPVLGAIVRYRSHALPFMVIIICILTDFNKIKQMLMLRFHRQP